MSENNTPGNNDTVREVRKACRQFAMLYFHFSKVLVETLGKEQAKRVVQQAIFELAVDRSDKLRNKAAGQDLPYTMETFAQVTDLPMIGWVKELGPDHCPYAEVWKQYFAEYPWFKEFAPFYCDVIDTTNAEVFTGKLSHKITENVLTGGQTCRREYFASSEVEKGVFSYGER